MIRALLRVTSLQTVLRATPPDSATQAATVVEGGHNWGLWEFDRAAVGEIGGQSPIGQHRLAPVRDLDVERGQWMSGVADEVRKHRELLADFAKGDFLDPPVLIHCPPHGWKYQMRDGAHRIFAAYEHLSGDPNRRLRVYWNRLAWP